MQVHLANKFRLHFTSSKWVQEWFIVYVITIGDPECLYISPVPPNHKLMELYWRTGVKFSASLINPKLHWWRITPKTLERFSFIPSEYFAIGSLLTFDIRNMYQTLKDRNVSFIDELNSHNSRFHFHLTLKTGK